MENISFNDFRALMMDCRTIRRFDESFEVGRESLLRLVELVRYCPSGRNAQPIRYHLVYDKEEREEVYPLLKWAGYYTDWDGPEPGERPAAYLIQLQDLSLGDSLLCDDGLQLQALTLGARTLGLGSCIIKAFNAPGLAARLGIDPRYRPLYVLALGKPAETPLIVDMEKEGDFKYYRDEQGRHTVPKRKLKDLLP